MSELTPKSEYEKLWKSFEESFPPRQWRFLCSSWPDRIQNPSALVVGAQETTLTDFIGQGGVLMTTPPKGQLTVVSHPRGEVPQIILREAILWLYKALHVLGASEMHVDQGLPSWSISSAYQCSYFAARSIMAFLGVSLAEFERVSVAVDLCRNTFGQRPQRIERDGVFEDNIRYRSIGVLFDHRQTWQLFQRILRSLTCSVWPEGWGNFFSQLEMADLTKQRHRLHYQLHYWILDDLHEFIFDEEFSKVEPTGTGRELFDCEKNNFSLAASSALTRMALLLFKDLSSATPRLAEDRRKVIAALSINRHPLFCDALNQEMAADV